MVKPEPVQTSTEPLSNVTNTSKNGRSRKRGDDVKAKSGVEEAEEKPTKARRSSARKSDIKAEESVKTEDQSKLEELVDDAETSLNDIDSAKLSARRKALDSKKRAFVDNLGKSPYPDFASPTPDTVLAVVNVLGEAHGKVQRPTQIPLDDEKRAGCGNIKSVLDALIRTILSQNTSDSNSTRAMLSLHAHFGKEQGKPVDSAFWERVMAADREELVETIRSGGLANVKAKVIQNILAQVYEKYGTCSLDHLYDVPDAQAMEELMSFQGVGGKTAGCVLLFCLSRDTLAVDTHIFRLSKMLGWVPQNATRETTQAHLDAVVPAELKHAVHVLLIRHGKVCSACKAPGRRANDPSCPISKYKYGAKKKAKEGVIASESDASDV